MPGEEGAAQPGAGGDAEPREELRGGPPRSEEEDRRSSGQGGEASRVSHPHAALLQRDPHRPCSGELLQ